MTSIQKSNECKYLIREAAIKLKNGEIEESYSLILNALNFNPDSPEPHNLLGIWYELKGDQNQARKHFRASYALDPTYEPATKNLERLCSFYIQKNLRTDFGY